MLTLTHHKNPSRQSTIYLLADDDDILLQFDTRPDRTIRWYRRYTQWKLDDIMPGYISFCHYSEEDDHVRNYFCRTDRTISTTRYTDGNVKNGPRYEFALPDYRLTFSHMYIDNVDLHEAFNVYRECPDIFDTDIYHERLHQTMQVVEADTAYLDLVARTIMDHWTPDDGIPPVYDGVIPHGEWYDHLLAKYSVEK